MKNVKKVLKYPIGIIVNTEDNFNAKVLSCDGKKYVVGICENAPVEEWAKREYTETELDKFDVGKENKDKPKRIIER